MKNMTKRSKLKGIKRLSFIYSKNIKPEKRILQAESKFKKRNKV
jgi:hypothetical protein